MSIEKPIANYVSCLIFIILFPALPFTLLKAKKNEKIEEKK